MTELGPIFLSASVPVEGREGYASAEPYLIKEAVSALMEVVLGRRLLVWGGQPAITPMLWEAAKQYSVPYQNIVQLYQSKIFSGRYPPENTAFPNFIETDAVDNHEARSLNHMRHCMLSAHEYSAAVFIGGMEGIREEYHIFRDLHPNAAVIPVPSPGGVSRELYHEQGSQPADFERAIDYSFWLYQLLNIDMLKERSVSFDRLIS